VERDPTPSTFAVRVQSVVSYGSDINCYEVTDPGGRDLPDFQAGSHIDVEVPGEVSRVRQYSLCSDPRDRTRYRFAVQREMSGRGGSKAIFERLALHSEVIISRPRNNFALRLAADRHLLLSGGIGITPMISMVLELQRQGSDFMLHYCTRSPERTAFLEILEPLVAKGRAAIHWDDGDPSKGLDLHVALKDPQTGTHLYYCGPPGFMSAVAAASAHWPSGSVHREYFTPSVDNLDPAAGAPESVENGFGPPFRVKIASTGQVIDVPSERSVLSVLREHGFEVEAQCELGVCGTCRTRYLEGEPDHRDFVLEPDEQSREMTLCCSRSKSPLLVLDL
jgi:vanillate O-demethylase ferredoxin subunit